jgi:choline-sulfatase
MSWIAKFCHRIAWGLSIALLCQAVFAAGDPGQEPPRPPNVLMICIDDLNDWTGFLGGHPQAQTPHMDALARRGMSFTNAHCAVPVCSASRISVMSGLPATTHGSYELGPAYDQLPALRHIPTLQRAFKDQGYLTIEGGKVLHHGFTGRIAADIDRSLGRSTSPRPKGPMNRPASWSGAWDWGAYPEADAEMADWQLAEAAADALSETFPQPFFLSVGFFRPHVPLFVPPKWFDHYPTESLVLAETPASDLLDLPSNFLTINDYAAAPTHADVVASGSQPGLTQAYLASISFVDNCVGRVLDALAASPHADNTIVVLWSDHGFHLGEKHHWAKRTLWEESTRVPLLVAGPGVQAAAECQEPASLIDLYPTLLELCGLPPQPHTTGLSLVPQLRDSTTPRHRPAITSSYEGNHAIRSKDWRLIHYRDGAEELYDHRTDPDERTNLADAPAHQERKQRLREWLPVRAAAEVKPRSERPADDTTTTRVFIFAGQSNMVGSDSKVDDIKRFPPFRGLEEPQAEVLFSYCLGREQKTRSDGWEALRPINNTVGPELSFAATLADAIKAPIAIIKVAAGGTHLGGDWNPDTPEGFEMYPLALAQVREALADLDRQGIAYRLEGFMWHQGENDMFNPDYMASYGRNLKNFLACWRRDLGVPNLRFFIGELCTKTIWGMDLRPRMDAIYRGQKAVSDADPLADYVPTSHVGVEIGGGVGLHYHYGTLGQLEHGVNYARAYLHSVGQDTTRPRPLTNWPYANGSPIKLFVLAGHRNMEGERAFVQDLKDPATPVLAAHRDLLADNQAIAYRYSTGGGVKVSDGWEPLGPAGDYDTFGPELSFAKALAEAGETSIAIGKFTHSGSQIIDWTPEGSEAVSRNLSPAFIAFIREAIADLEAKGHEVSLAGICYHVGENDMSWGPFRSGAAERVMSLVQASREDLGQPNLQWIISQQKPTDDPSVNQIDVTAQLEEAFSSDPDITHIKAFSPPPQDKQLVLDTAGVIWLGEELAEGWLSTQRQVDAN